MFVTNINLIVKLLKYATMKKIILLCLLGSFTFTSNAQILNYSIGQVVNDFSVTDINGVSHNLYTYTAAGKHVFLDYFFTTCGPCQQTTPTWNEFYDKYGCNAGDVICITLNSGQNNDAEVIAYENTYGGSFNHSPAVSGDGGSGAVDTDMNPSQYPTYCLIGPDNKLKNADIWPINSVADLEAAFPAGFSPSPMACSTGLEEENKQVSFTVYPNPNNGENINIMVDNATSSTVTISDLVGKTVYNTISTNQKFVQVNKTLKAGTYIINIEANGTIATQKLVIQ